MTYHAFIKIKVFCEVPDSLEAVKIRDQIAARLDVTSRMEFGDVKKYWKIPEYFEISIKVFPKELNEDTLDETANLLGSGWSKSNFSYVWNAGEKATFVEGHVKWANVELIELP